MIAHWTINLKVNSWSLRLVEPTTQSEGSRQNSANSRPQETYIECSEINRKNDDEIFIYFIIQITSTSFDKSAFICSRVILGHNHKIVSKR